MTKNEVYQLTEVKAMTEKQSVFETLSKIDVSNHVEKKMGLSYLSWAWAWQTVKSIYPETPNPKPTKYKEMLITKSGYELTEREVPYLTTPTGTIVEVTVTIKGVDYTQSLYVMDNRNKTVVNPSQAQINKTTQRCIVKALAMAGLGLNLYAGEDLPMGDISEKDKKQAEAKEQAEKQQVKERLDKALNILAEEQGTTATEVKAALVEQYKNEPAYKENPDGALLAGATAMYKQLQMENQKKQQQAG